MDKYYIEKVVLYINIFALLYFSFLAYISFYPIELTLFNVIAQLITIPLLLFLVFSFGYCSYRLIKKEARKNLILSFILSITSISFLVILTIMQMS